MAEPSTLVDSCGWIDYLVEGEHVAIYAPLVEGVAHLVVPTVVQYEVYKWTCREADEAMAAKVVARMEQGLVRPLDTRTALLAAELSARHGLAMADAIVYAHSRVDRVTLVTSDAHFADLPGVEFHARAD